MKVEIKKLNPDTLKTDNINGVEYRVTTLDSGAVSLEIVGDESQPIPSPHDPQQEATDAIMAGLIDTATQTSDANDAVMNAMIDVQIQLDAIKTKLGVV